MSHKPLDFSFCQEISDIATSQAKTFQEQQVSREKEMTSLRQQLLDFQSQSDEKTIIGKLHRHIVHLQLSEGTGLRKLDLASRKTLQLEAQVLRMEHRLDEKDQSLYHSRMESRAKAKHLKDTINVRSANQILIIVSVSSCHWKKLHVPSIFSVTAKSVCGICTTHETREIHENPAAASRRESQDNPWAAFSWGGAFEGGRWAAHFADKTRRNAGGNLRQMISLTCVLSFLFIDYLS